jgi:Domain of unknown function DUF29
MPGRRKDITADLAPGDEPPGAEYERDFYSWSIEQARLLREGRIDALDRDNLAEEIESQAREQFNKLVSALRVAMMHMPAFNRRAAFGDRRRAGRQSGTQAGHRRGGRARLSPRPARRGQGDRPGRGRISHDLSLFIRRHPVARVCAVNRTVAGVARIE